MDRDEFLYVLLRRAAREIERLEAVELSRTRARLRPAQVPVLAALLDASPLTPSELCARCEIEPSTLSGILQTLEKNGLIERERVIRDLRSCALRLTPAGRAAARVALKKRLAAQRAILRSLPREFAVSLPRVLSQLSDAAQAVAADNLGRTRATPTRPRT